jgi:ribosome-associated toxin RatA of RatAB toxin-antitoxin module
MRKIVKNIIVEKKLEEVFKKISTVENWPKLSQNFTHMEVLMQKDNKHISIMRSKHGPFNPPIVTVREFINGKGILFEHIVPAWPIREHHGDWIFEADGEGKTKIILTHNFSCYFGILGGLIARFVIEKHIMGPHIQEMLEEMKKSIEGQL